MTSEHEARAPGPVQDLDPIAGTARWTAAMRAAESTREDRLFNDPCAAILAGDPGRALMEQLGDVVAIPIRTRFFDDLLVDLVRARGIRQVALVAAGMDSRAYRLDLPPDARVFELDRPELLVLKDTLLAGVAPTCPRRPVFVDLAEDLRGALVVAGLNPGSRTVWLLEGLAQYLDSALVERLLDQISALSAPGSQLLIDMVGESLLTNAAMRPWLDDLARRGMRWIFGTDEPERLLTPRGWRCAVTLLSSAGVRYGRWPFPDAPRGTPGVPQGYLIHAELDPPVAEPYPGEANT